MKMFKKFLVLNLLLWCGLFFVSAQNTGTEVVQDNPEPMWIVRDEVRIEDNDIDLIQKDEIDAEDLDSTGEEIEIIPDNGISDQIWWQQESLLYTTLSDNIFSVGQYYSPDRMVDGEIYALWQTILLDKSINDSVFIAGQSVTLSSSIDGNVRAFANYLTFNGATIQKDISAFGQTVVIKDTNVNGEMHIGGTSVVLNGVSAKKIDLSADMLTLEGKIQGDMTLEFDSIKRGEWTKILGNVSYTSSTPVENIDQYVQWEVNYTQATLNYDTDGDYEHSFGFLKSVWFWIYVIILAGWYFLLRKKLRLWTLTIKAHIGKSLLYGVLYYLLLMVLPIILFITIVGAPLAFVVLLLAVLTVLLIKFFVMLFAVRCISNMLWNAMKGNALVLVEILTVVVIAVLFTLLPRWIVGILSLFVWWGLLYCLFHGCKGIVK